MRSGSNSLTTEILIGALFAGLPGRVKMDGHDAAGTDAEITVALGEDYPELRSTVRRICEKFPGEYWRDLDSRSGYPTEFVAALTDAGFLGALIPETYGGSGLPLRAAA